MFQKFIWQMLSNCLAAASPEIVEGIRKSVQEMVEKAKKTPNPWDDMFTQLLQNIVGRPKEPIEDPESDPRLD